ncbi:MAG: hypothetical protein ACPGVU_19120 [Limisphaerales bacterium]
MLRIIREWPNQYVEVRTEKNVPAGDWASVSVSVPSANRAAGVEIRFNGRNARPYLHRDTLEVEVEIAGEFVFGANRLGPAVNGALRDFRVYSRQLSRAELTPLNQAFDRALKTAPAQRDQLQKQLLDDFYFTLRDPGIGPSLRHLHTAEQKLHTINAGAGRCLVMGDLEGEGRKTYALIGAAMTCRMRAVRLLRACWVCWTFHRRRLPRIDSGWLAGWFIRTIR